MGHSAHIEYGNSQEIGEGIRFTAKKQYRLYYREHTVNGKKKQEKEILKNLYNETS